jgi:hypothetical protein
VRRAFGLLLWMLSAAAAGAGVAPTIANGEVGVRIDAVAFPSTLSRELASGLTNRLYMRISVLDGQTVVQTRTAEITIRYDLWEEKFTVTRTMEQAPAETQQVANIAEVNSILASLRIPQLFVVRSLPGNRDLKIRCEMLLNPISREKMRMIRKWVAENSTPDIGADPGISSSNTIFNRIFEQYADGSEVVAEWHVDLVSPPFRPAALGNEAR